MKVPFVCSVVFAVMIMTLSCSNDSDNPTGPSNPGNGDTGNSHEIEGHEFITIPGGTFEMGDETGDLSDSEKPVHTVTVSSFEMGVYEVTNLQYADYLNSAFESGDIIVRNNRVKGVSGNWRGETYIDMGFSTIPTNRCWIEFDGVTFSVDPGKEQLPAGTVFWYGAKAFAEYYGFDLPTESEWEYACRGGRQYKYGTDDGTISKEKGNYDHESECAVDVGSYPSNPFGLYDMCGNISEWCDDWFCTYLDSQDFKESKILRGGSFHSDEMACRSAARCMYGTDETHESMGFRVVFRTVTPGVGNSAVTGRILLDGNGLSGVTVTMGNFTTKTDENGEYLFTDIAGGTYTLVFDKTDYLFSPETAEITVDDEDVTVGNITASERPPFYSVTGHVLSDGTGIPGVTVIMGDVTAETDDNGVYLFSDITDGAYSITYTKTGFLFEPEAKEITVDGNNVAVDDVSASVFEGNDPHDIHGIACVTIPGGTFRMGDVQGFGTVSELPLHTVTVSTFEMSIYEVTNAQYAVYLNEALLSGDIEISNSRYVHGTSGPWSGSMYLDFTLEYYYNSSIACRIEYADGTFAVESGKENRPVVGVTWHGAKAFAEHYGLDLPTEAEWEYASRGGREYTYGTHDGTIGTSLANYGKNVGSPVDVGSYSPNPFGLYNMSGNVLEWCHDWYDPDYYLESPSINPTGPSSPASLEGPSGLYNRVVRGGSWLTPESTCRSAWRSGLSHWDTAVHLGFRVVMRKESD